MHSSFRNGATSAALIPTAPWTATRLKNIALLASCPLVSLHERPIARPMAASTSTSTADGSSVHVDNERGPTGPSDDEGRAAALKSGVGKEASEVEVELDRHEDPKHQSNARKWVQVLTICSAASCVTCFSSVVRSPYSDYRTRADLLCVLPHRPGPLSCDLLSSLPANGLDMEQAGFTQPALQSTFSVSKTVSILPISLFVEGLGLGPLLLAPLSEFFGRALIYRVSYGLFVLLNLPVAFSQDICESLRMLFHCLPLRSDNTVIRQNRC